MQEKVVSNTPAETQVINFTGPMDLTVELKSSDNFETAEMTDNSGKVYHLKRAISGSGMRLANNDGVSIHFKAGEGIVEFMKDKPISITEYKNKIIALGQPTPLVGCLLLYEVIFLFINRWNF